MSDELQITPNKEDAAAASQSEKKSQNTPQKEGNAAVDAYGFVDDVVYDNEILKKVSGSLEKKEDIVIYGVYNNSDKGLFTQINDFFIDHTKVSLKDKAYFFDMLAMMVGAGVPVVQAVKSLAMHTENLKFRRVLNTVAYYCESGSTLADSMSRFDDIFDETEIGIMRAGEVSGKLNQMLQKLAEQLDKRHDLLSKLFSAAIYPIAILGVLILVAIGMLVWVLPTLLSLLGEGGLAGDKLPFATRALIVVQGGLVNYWWVILIVLFGGYGVFSAYFSTTHGAVSGDYWKLKIPLVGNLLRKVYVLNFIAMLGLLVDAGLPVIKAISISGNAVSNKIYKLAAQNLIEKVKKGEKISDGLAESEFLFPPELVQMLRVGEGSANLAQVSEKISSQYQREVDNSLRRMTAVFEPVMILFVGLFVAVLAMAIMAPIFNLGTSVGSM